MAPLQDASADRRDRAFLLAGLVGLSALAWAYSLALAQPGPVPHALLHPQTRAWSATDLATTFLMWNVMMVAMMAPTAAPMLLTLARIGRGPDGAASPLGPAAGFVLGYLGVWGVYSGVATLAQWALHERVLVSEAGAVHGAALGGLLLLGAGAFQLTPLKQACLRRCRSPLGFLLTAWRPGTRGAFRMGLRHGAFCVGCCWALMALMFVGGTMNLLWAAALMFLMLAEKLLPDGARTSRLAGLALLAWGSFCLGRSWVGA